MNSSQNDWVLLSPDPLDSAAAIAFVTDPAAGGIDVFIGTTRSDDDSAKGELQALDYDAYAEMARKQMAALVTEARTRWPLRKCAILHRTGLVAVSEPSVVIAVSCPHRGDAFDACRFLIDSLKASAAIWKKDIYRHGARWHHDPAG